MLGIHSWILDRAPRAGNAFFWAVLAVALATAAARPAAAALRRQTPCSNGTRLPKTRWWGPEHSE